MKHKHVKKKRVSIIIMEFFDKNKSNNESTPSDTYISQFTFRKLL